MVGGDERLHCLLFLVAFDERTEKGERELIAFQGGWLRCSMAKKCARAQKAFIAVLADDWIPAGESDLLAIADCLFVYDSSVFSPKQTRRRNLSLNRFAEESKAICS